ncbi:SDR family NAD(P)-dependent oxidoreductase [Desulfosoma sp.]
MPQKTMENKARLDGQLAVISGAGRGIGRAAAEQLARVGARVALAARSEKALHEAAEAIRAQGGRAEPFVVDVSQWEDVRRMAESVRHAHGAPHIVVGNAGVIEPVGPAWTLDPKDWAYNLAVNVTGAFHLVRAFGPSMVEAGRGVFIFTSSGAAKHPVAGWSAYCAAKAGLDLFAETLAEELRTVAPSLRVHVLYPGVVDTAMQQKIRETPPERFPRVKEFQAYHAHGVLRPAHEPAALIWWLATPFAADYHGRVASLDDPAVRRPLAADLGLPLFASRPS